METYFLLFHSLYLLRKGFRQSNSTRYVLRAGPAMLLLLAPNDQ